MWGARRALAHLRRSNHTAAPSLAEALAASLGAMPEEAAAWFARIERLRARLAASAAVLTYQDFGAGGRLRAARPRPAARPVRAVSRAAVPPHEGRLLFELIRRFRPARCLELGTSLGLSAAYQAAALACNGAGRLVTLEGGAALARQAGENLAALGLDAVEIVVGPFAETLPAVLERHRRFDFVFLDGHHDPAATHAYLETLWPHLTPGAVLLLDDLAWTTGMRRAWKALAADARLGLTADLLVFGIAVLEARLERNPAAK